MKISEKVPRRRHHSLQNCKDCLQGFQKKTSKESLVSSASLLQVVSSRELQGNKTTKNMITKPLQFTNIKSPHLFLI